MPAETVVLVIVAASSTIAVLAAAWWFSPDNVLRRRIRAVPVTPAIKAGSGLARISGTILPDRIEQRAPLSGRVCAWFGAYVDVHHSSGKSGRWVQLIRDEQCVDFYVDDGTAVVLVRCTAPQVLSARDVASSSGMFDDATETERAFLARHGQEDTNLLGMNRRLRYREAAFEPGERVSVIGELAPGDDRLARYVMTAGAAGQVIMTDERGTA